MLHSRASQHGLTLVELMISTTLGAVVVAGAVTAVLASGRVQRNQTLMADAAENARLALFHIARQIEHAGVGGPTVRTTDAIGNIVTLPVLRADPGSANPICANGIHDINRCSGTNPVGVTPDALYVLRVVPDERTVILDDFSDVTGVSPLRIFANPHATTNARQKAYYSDAYRWLLVTNTASSVLLKVTNVNQNTYNSIPILELSTNPADLSGLSTTRNPFKKGDFALPARFVRYRLVFVDGPDNHPEKDRFYMVEEIFDPLHPPAGPYDTTGVLSTHRLAEGVEDFKIEWGWDRDGDGIVDPTVNPDPMSTANGWTATPPSDADLANPSLLFARLSVSVRTRQELIDGAGRRLKRSTSVDDPVEVGLQERIGVQPDDAPPALPTTSHRRRVVQTIVPLRNLRKGRL